jgi:hypothetical protein
VKKDTEDFKLYIKNLTSLNIFKKNAGKTGIYSFYFNFEGKKAIDKGLYYRLFTLSGCRELNKTRVGTIIVTCF